MKPRVSRNLHDYIYLLKELPLRPPILLESDAEQRVFLITRHKYQSASLWLRHMLLGEALQLEAYQPPGLYTEPFAEFLAAHFRLVTAVYCRTTCHELLKFNSPADLWFYSCTVMSAHHLAQKGLTDVPLLMGKRKAWQWAVKITANLRALSYKPDPIPTMLKDPTTFVVLEAQEIAKVDKDFYAAHLLPYIQSVRRSAKKDKECSNVQFHYLLPNGTLFETGEKKKLPHITSIKK